MRAPAPAKTLSTALKLARAGEEALLTTAGLLKGMSSIKGPTSHPGMHKSSCQLSSPCHRQSQPGPAAGCLLQPLPRDLLEQLTEADVGSLSQPPREQRADGWRRAMVLPEAAHGGHFLRPLPGPHPTLKPQKTEAAPVTQRPRARPARIPGRTGQRIPVMLSSQTPSSLESVTQIKSQSVPIWLLSST